MSVYNGSHDAAMMVAQKSLGVKLKFRTYAKAVGPCPECGGDDRFVVWLFEQFAWCSICKSVRKFGNMEDSKESLAKVRGERLIEASRIRVSMASSVDWMEYYQNVDLGLWMQEGFTDDMVSKNRLGYTNSCPSYRCSSLTIPIFYRGVLMDIRHKLLNVPPENGKYRSHVSGLIPHPHNLDILDADPELVIVVEGEKKSMVLIEGGYSTIGIPSMNITSDLFAAMESKDNRSIEFVFMLDPGAEEPAKRMAIESKRLGYRSKVAHPWMKPDDLMFSHGSRVIDELIYQSMEIKRL